MSSFNFNDLKALGIRVSGSYDKSLLKKEPEELLIEAIKLASTDAKVYSLILTYLKYMLWAFDTSVLLKKAKSLKQIERKLLYGFLYKAGENLVFDLEKLEYLFSDSKISKIHADHNPDPDMKKFGILVGYCTEEDISKYDNLLAICSINKKLEARLQSRTPEIKRIQNLKANEIKLNIMPENDPNYHLANLGIIKHYDLKNFYCSLEDSIMFLVEYSKGCDLFERYIASWVNQFKDFIEIKVKLNKPENPIRFDFRSSDYISNRVIGGLSNKMDILTLIRRNRSLSIYRIAKILNINYESAHRNYKSLEPSLKLLEAES